MKENQTLLDRFNAKYYVRPDGCWQWTACKTTTGYGAIGMKKNGKHVKEHAHRVAYILFVGDIPIGFHIHHLCKKIDCVNPEHLECISSYDHYGNRHLDVIEVMALKRRAITHCHRGHPFNSVNTRWDTDGGRTCRICANDYHKQYQQAQRDLKKMGVV